MTSPGRAMQLYRYLCTVVVCKGRWAMGNGLLLVVFFSFFIAREVLMGQEAYRKLPIL